MSGKSFLDPVPHVLHELSHLIFKSNQPIKVYMIISTL